MELQSRSSLTEWPIGGRMVAVLLSVFVCCGSQARAGEPAHRATLRVATFEADVTPPIGSPLCYGFVPPAKSVDDPLSARGIVLLGAGKPIVLCAVDWTGIRNATQDAWREALAKAVGTTASRVALTTLHQHDAPGVDGTADELLQEAGVVATMHNLAATRDAIRRSARAARESVKTARPVTHVGQGKAKVERVASSRRVFGPDGRVQHVRYSACRDPEIRAAPEGVIDQDVRLLSLWNGDEPLAVLSYYATHPQSYYGRGGVSADFVGLARTQWENEVPDVPHIHFNGAGGDIAAGKYNDGSEENRPALASRLAAGMRAAWESTKRVPLQPADVHWHTRRVLLPLKTSMQADAISAVLHNPQASDRQRFGAALKLSWMERVAAKQPIDVSCLRLGPACVLHLPGELFVEYQLAAQQMQPEMFVCLAAYCDNGPGYIGTREAYAQGGYEVGQWSYTAPEVEDVLMGAMRSLLQEAAGEPAMNDETP
ncbi:MAG: neutral/alkaline non-lysosomal ceramidase N-terminal domain-containing protein [Planctomycetaceae bacterium]|nr:neutral/alkaline non-lysosomal ceramidase N-terminal domain-containing protein [Planctomycetaceae bacterium]